MASQLESLVNRSIRTLSQRFDRNPRLKALVADSFTSENRSLNWALLKRKTFYRPSINLEQQLSKHTFTVSKGLQLMRAMSAICELENEAKKPARKQRKEAWARDIDFKLSRQSHRAVTTGTILLSHPLFSLNEHRNAVCLVVARSPSSCMGVLLDHFTGQYDDPVPNDRRLMAEFMRSGAFACTNGGPSSGIAHFHRPISGSEDGVTRSFGATPIFEKCKFVDGPFFCGGDPKELSVAARAGEVDWHCFNGFVSWDNGQLRREMAEGAWIACESTSSLLFDERIDRETLWQQLLQLLGGEYAAMASLKDLPQSLLAEDVTDLMVQDFNDLFGKTDLD